MNIYAASRASLAARPAMWRALRERGALIVSTWVDTVEQALDGRTLWQIITADMAKAERLVLYVEPDDFPLKGALVEVGMALSQGIPVVVVAPGVILAEDMAPLGSWVLHPLVTFCDSIELAVGLA